MIIQQQIIYQVELSFQTNAFKDPEDIGLAITETNLHIWHFHKPNWACINVWLFFFFFKDKDKNSVRKNKTQEKEQKSVDSFPDAPKQPVWGVLNIYNKIKSNRCTQCMKLKLICRLLTFLSFILTSSDFLESCSLSSEISSWSDATWFFKTSLCNWNTGGQSGNVMLLTFLCTAV